MTATKIWPLSSKRFVPAKPRTSKCAPSSYASKPEPGPMRSSSCSPIRSSNISPSCWSAFDVTVEEGLHALTTLCLVEVSPHNAPSYHCIPTPRDAIARLLHSADITLPKAFSLSGTQVSTKKKLQSERLGL